jgi:hypothetical protein
MMKKILIIIIITILLSLPICSATSLFEKNIRFENKVYNLNPIGIKIGTINIDADGTLRGTNVEVEGINSDLSDYYGETVFFYIAYSITNEGPNDHVLIEYESSKNDVAWKKDSITVYDNYKLDKIIFPDVEIIQGDQYNTHIIAFYTNTDPDIFIYDEDISTLSLKYNYLVLLEQIIKNFAYLEKLL